MTKEDPNRLNADCAETKERVCNGIGIAMDAFIDASEQATDETISKRLLGRAKQLFDFTEDCFREE